MFKCDAKWEEIVRLPNHNDLRGRFLKSRQNGQQSKVSITWTTTAIVAHDAVLLVSRALSTFSQYL